MCGNKEWERASVSKEADLVDRSDNGINLEGISSAQHSIES